MTFSRPVVFRPIRSTLGEPFDSILDQMRTHTPVPRAFPPLNIWEDAGAIHLEAELPGFSMNDLEIVLEKDLLTLKGKREITTPDGSEFLHRERAAGAFSRTVRVGEQIDPDRVSATLTHGVLSITLPKTPAATARKIAINAAQN